MTGKHEVDGGPTAFPAGMPVLAPTLEALQGLVSTAASNALGTEYADILLLAVVETFLFMGIRSPAPGASLAGMPILAPTPETLHPLVAYATGPRPVAFYTFGNFLTVGLAISAVPVLPPPP